MRKWDNQISKIYNMSEMLGETNSSWGKSTGTTRRKISGSSFKEPDGVRI